MKSQRHKLNYRLQGMDGDLRAFLHYDACPSCTDNKWIETLHDDSTYLDDEEMCMTEFGPRFFPYKDYVCGNCGAQFRVYQAPISIRITQESDTTTDDDGGPTYA